MALFWPTSYYLPSRIWPPPTKWTNPWTRERRRFCCAGLSLTCRAMARWYPFIFLGEPHILLTTRRISLLKYIFGILWVDFFFAVFKCSYIFRCFIQIFSPTWQANLGFLTSRASTWLLPWPTASKGAVLYWKDVFLVWWKYERHLGALVKRKGFFEVWKFKHVHATLVILLKGWNFMQH